MPPPSSGFIRPADSTLLYHVAALIANVAGPGSARALIVLLDCNPGDACSIVVVSNADVAGIQPGRILIDDLFADSAGIDLAPVARARVAVARVESIYAINGAAPNLVSALALYQSWIYVPHLHDCRLQRSGFARLKPRGSQV